MLPSISNPHNRSESTLIKMGPGQVSGIVVNSHTSGTLKLVDGLYNGVAASGTLTSSGASAPADYAVGTLTSTGTAVADGDTVVIGATGGTAITYRAKTTPIAINDVAIGSTANGADFLANLKKAINGTGLGDGTDYFKGTTASPDIIASTLAATTLLVAFRTLGTAGNSYTTTETSSQLSWGAGTLLGGITTAAATIVIDSVTYMAVKTLSETIGLPSVANQILWVTSEAIFLDNVKAAINQSGLPGTDYSSATVNHPTVVATTNSNTQQVVVAKRIGTPGNAIVSTTTLANYAWGAATLASGTGPDGKVMLNTFTFPTGSGVYNFGTPLNFNTGLLAVVGGTLDYTLGVK